MTTTDGMMTPEVLEMARRMAAANSEWAPIGMTRQALETEIAETKESCTKPMVEHTITMVEQAIALADLYGFPGIPGTDPDFANFTLGAYEYGELVVVANEVVTDAWFDIAEFLGRELGRALGRKIGTELVLGSGSGQPTGVSTAAESCGSVTTGGT
jgi:HK97 family phage major capsid protein